MRILLAALNAQKGDLAGNLARHQAALEQARVQGCQVAVFPEFSLTGSVDTRRHPEAAGVPEGVAEPGRQPPAVPVAPAPLVGAAPVQPRG